MSDHVLIEKVRRPAGEGLRRPRLIGPLIGDGAPRVAVVVAPAGSGKTTMLAHVASSAPTSVAWYRAGADDSSERDLVRHLGAALRALLGGAGLDVVVDMDDLLHRLDLWSGQEGLLVVDDLHEIAGTPAERALARLLDLGPPRLHVLLGSRRPPTMNLSRLQVTNALLRVSGDDLRFRSWEVEALYRHVYREVLPPEAAAALTRRTEGWAAGLQMFHLATAGETAAARRAAVEALSGRHRLMRSYLVDNVLAGLSTSRRSFLVRTCTLGTLSGALCDDLLGATDSQGVLRRLEEDQLFTTSGDDGLTFRYHQVLQDHLEVALREDLGRDEARGWYRRSARLLEAHGHVRDALRAFALAEDWASAAQLLTRAGARVTSGGRWDWEVLLPAALREADPWLELGEARHRLRRGSVAAAVEHYRHAETLLDDPGFQAQCRLERRVASAWLPDTRGVLTGAEAPGEVRDWSERLRAATVRLRQRERPGIDPPGAAGDRLEHGLVDLLAGRALDAERELASVLDEAEPHSVEQVVAVTASALLTALTGGAATAELESAALAAEFAGLPWLERLARVVLSRTAEVPDDALRGSAWEDVEHECRTDGDAWGAALVQVLRGTFGVLAADRLVPDLVDDCCRLQEGAARFRGMRAPVLATWADSLHVLGLARLGADDAEELAQQVWGSARLLGMPGAQALTRYALASLHRVPSRELTLLAAELRQVCGLPASVPAVPTTDPAGSVATTSTSVDRTVEVRLLGGFQVEVAGNEMSWAGARPRALALLRMLALSPDVDVHRERLVDALWPDADVAAGTHRLQVAVSSLRRVLDDAGLPGGTMLPRHGDAYRLSLSTDARVDVDELRRAVSEAAAARSSGNRETAMRWSRLALELYRGELLPEDGPAEWVVEERDRLRVLVAVVARRLAEDCCALGDLPGAIAAGERSLELDPFQDLTWDVVVRAHERAGDGTAAARLRRQHAQLTADLAAAGEPPAATRRGTSQPGQGGAFAAHSVVDVPPRIGPSPVRRR